MTLVRDTIEEGLSAQLDREIATALAGEEAEPREIQMRTNRLESGLVLFVLSVVGAASWYPRWRVRARSER